MLFGPATPSRGAFAALWAGITLLAAIILFPSSSLALTPPRAGTQFDQNDPTLAQRREFAKQLGNHRFDPGLVSKMRQKLAVANGKSPLPPSGWLGGLPATGNPKVVVLLVDFPDAHDSGIYNTMARVASQFFGDGIGDYPYESLRNFYQRSSYNALTIGGNVLGWYRASHNRSYYEGLGADEGREALISEAMDYFASPAGGSHDFSQYDNDGDGAIDAFYVKWTGPTGAWASFWWAYQTRWRANPSYTISGKRLDKYVWSEISSQVSPFYWPRVDIHETGHLLGLPDYYDYDAAVGPLGGIRQT